MGLDNGRTLQSNRGFGFVEVAVCDYTNNKEESDDIGNANEERTCRRGHNEKG